MVSALVVAALSIGSAPAVATAALSGATPRGYHPGHVILRRGARARAPQQPALRNASLAHTVSYFGGKVIPHVKVYAVVWGPGTYQPEVTASSAPSVSNFFTGITNSRYLDWMHEYDTNVTPVGGGSGTNQTIGRGTFGGLFTITPAAGNNGATIDDATNIQPELNAQIHAGHLPAPDANSEYFLFFRQNQVITEGGMNSVTDFCAYHNTFGPPSFASEAYYTVVPFQTGGGCGSEATSFGNLTSTVGHELIESVSDPEIGLASDFAPPLGWYDQSENEEIADLCESVGSGDGSVLGGDGISYFVQLGWSDAQNGCVVNSGSVPAGTVPGAPTSVVATTGVGNVTVTWTAPGDDGGNPITDYRVAATPGSAVVDVDGTQTTATVTGLTVGTQYTFTVTAITGVGAGNASTPSNQAGPATVPGAPTNANGAPGNASVSVSWTAPVADGGSAITGYTVTPFVGTTALAAHVFNVTATTETINGLTNGTRYTFRVKARNVLGSSAPSSPTPEVAPLATTAMAIGDAHTCAVLTAGRTVACWGLNHSGQLGDGSTTSRSVPVAVTGLSNVRVLALGGAHSCALSNNGTVSCWGRGTSGQLGNGNATSSSSPVAVSGLSGVTAIAAGRLHTCALLAGHTVECWGDNSVGELGDQSTTQRNAPVPVHGLSGVVLIAAASNQTCALLASHTVKCWGWNSAGQLGDGSTTNRTAPVTVVGISTAVGVATSGAHSCAVLSNGTAKCWGLNSNGELGIGSLGTHHTPVAVSGLRGVRSIAAGDSSTCALLTNATLECWGNNTWGELGDATIVARRTTPVPVRIATSVVSVGCGIGAAIERRSNGGLRTWGRNDFGQLGKGNTTDPNNTIAKVVGLG